MYDRDDAVRESGGTTAQEVPFDRLQSAMAAIDGASADELITEAAQAASGLLPDGCTVVAADGEGDLAGEAESVPVRSAGNSSYSRLAVIMNDGVAPSRADSAVVKTIAEYAGVLTDNQRLQTEIGELQERVANLQIALDSNRQIGAAIGILMHRHKITYQAGFDLLRDVSQRTHTKLHEVADEVVRTGALPRKGAGS